MIPSVSSPNATIFLAGLTSCRRRHADRAGELFYASGEVAVKAPQVSTSSHAPRLGVVQSGQPRGGSQVPTQPQVYTQQQGGPEESNHEVELRLKAALESLSAAETKMAELAREEAQARFDCEDAQIRHATVKTKVLTRFV